jgi:predicted MFS family arabinose efflux permease
LSARPSPRAAFAHRNFTIYQGARFAVTLGLQMQSVAVGWQVYEATRDPLHLGWVGLAQFAPLIALALVTGQAADRRDRRRIVAGCYAVFVLGSLALAWFARSGHPPLAAIYAVLVALGAARAFYGPATSALMPALVPPADFPNAVAWSSTFWQVATVAGPALGGLLYAPLGASGVYGLAAVLSLAGIALVFTLKLPARPSFEPGASRLGELFAGLAFVWREKLVLGAISLDLFAVLLGGAVALLPAIARDVLHTGPTALGLLRGAPGATLTALWLAFRPLERRSGALMLGGVLVFGLATIVLGVSRSLPLSMAALVTLGAADMISVYVRHNLVTLLTPDAMRGRVSAVNQVFIGASNELGEFESGLTAAWLGVVPAVIAGGVGTCVVVALWSVLFPALRRVDRLGAAPPTDETTRDAATA